MELRQRDRKCPAQRVLYSRLRNVDLMGGVGILHALNILDIFNVLIFPKFLSEI